MTPKKLKAWRKANRYTQETLAKALKVHRVTVAKWETGRTEMPRFLDLALDNISLKKKKKYQTVIMQLSG